MGSEQPPTATIRLSGFDTTFILDEPVETQHTLKIAVFDEPSSKGFKFEHISEALGRAVAVLPQMQWKVQSVPLGLAPPMWITDPAFDIRDHLRHARLPEPGTKTQLCHTIGEVATDPIPPGRPPWELWFLDGFEGAKVVAVLKMNHAMANGGTIAELLDKLTGPEPNMPPVAPPVPRPVGPLSRRDAMRDGVRGFWRELRRELPRRTRAIQKARAKARVSKPLTRPPSILRGPKMPWRGPLTAPRSFSWVSLSLGEVKEIAKVISGTVNDVIFAIVAGAVRESLAEAGMLQDRPVVANAAAKSRKEGDTQLWGTTATSVPFALPTHVADPLERLNAAHEQSAAVKAQAAARPVNWEDLFDLVPPILLTPMLRLMRLAVQRLPGGVIVSNVKGPREKRYIGGMGIENFISCGHLKYAAGINVTVWSYDKMLNFAVYGCSTTLPDAELFTERIQSAFDELRAATGASPKLATNGTERPEDAEAEAGAAERENHV